MGFHQTCHRCSCPYDEEVPAGWELIRLTQAELDELCDAAFAGDVEMAEAVVERAYASLFGEHVN